MNCPPYPHKPIMTIWIFPAKKRTKLFHANGDTKKTMKLIISPFWLFYRHGYIKQMNWNTFKMTKKGCRFYLFDFQIDNKNIWFIMVYHQTIWYIFSYVGAISIRLLILNNVSTLWNFIMGLAFSEVAQDTQYAISVNIQIHTSLTYVFMRRTDA